jgi:hypothetical protein
MNWIYIIGTISIVGSIIGKIASASQNRKANTIAMGITKAQQQQTPQQQFQQQQFQQQQFQQFQEWQRQQAQQQQESAPPPSDAELKALRQTQVWPQKDGQ